MHSSKSKAIGISASSFLSLQAELAAQKEELKKAKAEGLKRPRREKVSSDSIHPFGLETHSTRRSQLHGHAATKVFTNGPREMLD